MLVAAKLQTTMLVNRQPTESLTTAARLVSELLDQTLAASRTLTAELSPPVLYDAGLGPALQWLARHFLDKHGLDIDVEFAPPAEPRTEDLRIFMFDAVREALFNVAKHSGVTKARVNGFRGPEGRVHVVVSDGGKGFNPTGLQGGGRSEGFGLFSIQQRIKHLGGRLEIDAAPEKGTRLTLIGPKPRISQRHAPSAVPPARTEAIMGKPSELGKIRVLLVDDHHIIRQGLAGLLRMDPGIEIVGEASNGAQAIHLTRSLLPDVVVMDVSMPVLGGIEATAEIHRDFPEVRVIGLSMHEEGELSSAMRKAGACMYVTKGGAPEALIKAIHSVMRGKIVQVQAQ
jgi:CheY-like chemotaxis protein